MVVHTETKPTFTPGSPEVLSTGRHLLGNPSKQHDISPDGKRFLMIKQGEPTGERPGSSSSSTPQRVRGTQAAGADGVKLPERS